MEQVNLKRRRGRLWLGVGVGLLGVAGIAGMMYRRRLSQNKSCTASEFHGAQRQLIESFLRDEQAFRETGSGKWKKPLTLFQYSSCPFCNKVRAVLDYHQVPYGIVEVDPLFKKEIQDTGYSKVPQLLVSGDSDAQCPAAPGPLGEGDLLLVDSEALLDVLEPLLKDGAEAPGVSEDVKRWRKWAGEVLVRYLVLNTNRSLAESLQGYDYVDESLDYSTWRKMLLKYVGSTTMFLVSKYVTAAKLRKQFGYDASMEAPEGPERANMMKEILSWQEEGLGGSASEKRPFHGGTKPDRADLEVYGILQSVRPLPVYDDIVESAGGRLVQWLKEMDEVMPAKYAAVRPISEPILQKEMH